jgi:CRISPR/Cas system-associated protein Cas5 (RAMP superfamily)
MVVNSQRMKHVWKQCEKAVNEYGIFTIDKHYFFKFYTELKEAGVFRFRAKNMAARKKILRKHMNEHHYQWQKEESNKRLGITEERREEIAKAVTKPKKTALTERSDDLKKALWFIREVGCTKKARAIMEAAILAVEA